MHRFAPPVLLRRFATAAVIAGALLLIAAFGGACAPRSSGPADDAPSAQRAGAPTPEGPDMTPRRSAVDAALDWLARHQEPDGSWAAEKHGGKKQCSLAVTGLALLAFMGGGHNTRAGEYRPNVLRGIDSLLRRQDADGRIGTETLYTHAIGAIALCEAHGRAGHKGKDARLEAAAQRAVRFCEKAVAADGGWRYAPAEKRGDMSVTAWFTQAIQTARMSQLMWDPVVFARAILFMDSVTDQGSSKDSNGLVAYQFKDGQAYSLSDSNSGGRPALTAAAIWIRRSIGMGATGHIQVKGAEAIVRHPPDWDHKDFYYWYFATYATHTMQNKYRAGWIDRIRDVLLTHQAREGDEAGSWDPKDDLWGDQGGRVYTTALGALCLEVYSRYPSDLTREDLMDLLLQQ
jgi:hypothetical protein